MDIKFAGEIKRGLREIDALVSVVRTLSEALTAAEAVIANHQERIKQLESLNAPRQRRTAAGN